MVNRIILNDMNKIPLLLSGPPKRPMILLLILLIVVVVHSQRQLNFQKESLALIRLHQNTTSPNSYIVVFKDTASQQEINTHLTSIAVTHNYDLGTFKGYAITLSSRNDLYKLRKSPLVKYIEQDHKVTAQERQYLPPWGLARISHRTRNFPNMFEYLYYTQAGQGVSVYIADTGVRITHSEFEGRATWGKTIPVGEPDSDNVGHGTHVAGTIAGKTYGVAKKANIISVKVLSGDGSGSASDVIAGLGFILQHYNANPPPKGGVVNLSISGDKSPALNDAVEALISAGIFVVAAAGNSNSDACQYSPGSSPKLISVAASDSDDVRASFSNWGPCVTLFAPGKDVKSAHNKSDDDNTSMSGTSMATPHVAGVVALLLSRGQGGGSPDSMKKWLLNIATNNTIKDNKNTTNSLLWSDPPQ